jgi:hypothetical protein
MVSFLLCFCDLLFCFCFCVCKCVYHLTRSCMFHCGFLHFHLILANGTVSQIRERKSKTVRTCQTSTKHMHCSY